VTGNGWAFPIDVASADVTLPDGVPPDAIRGEAYTGRPGAQGRDYQTSVEQGVARFTTTRRLAAGEGLTIVTTWPAGYVKQPTRFMQMQYVFRDEQPLFLGCGGLALLVAYYLVIWLRVGRDPPRGIVVPLYEPPESLSPAVMRYLLRMRYDDRCFAAAVLNLAVQGYLTIDEETPKTLVGHGRVYKLTRSAKAVASELSRDEKVTLEGLFRAGNCIELTPDNSEIVQSAKSEQRKCLRVLYMPGFFQINGGWHALGIVTSLLIAGSTFLFHGSGDFGPSWFLLHPLGHATLAAVMLGFVANGVFGKLLQAPTRRGRALMDRIEGFRLYLSLAEGPDLKRMTSPPATTQLYERYLPAALALNVEQRWAERFAAVFAMQAASSTPNWYNGSDWDPSDVGRSGSSLASSLEGAVSSASSSSSSPGSSSGSDGGGSSGGGGGGGGGGGW